MKVRTIGQLRRALRHAREDAEVMVALGYQIADAGAVWKVGQDGALIFSHTKTALTVEALRGRLLPFGDELVVRTAIASTRQDRPAYMGGDGLDVENIGTAIYLCI